MRYIKTLLIAFYVGSANFSLVYGHQRYMKYRLLDTFEAENESTYLFITYLLMIYGTIGIAVFIINLFRKSKSIDIVNAENV